MLGKISAPIKWAISLIKNLLHGEARDPASSSRLLEMPKTETARARAERETGGTLRITISRNR